MSAAAIVLMLGQRSRQNKLMKVVRKRLRDAENPFDATSDNHFIDLYRFPKFLCLELCAEIEPFWQKRIQSHGIPYQIRVLCALRFFASGCFQRSIGQDFFSSISQTVVSRCIKEVATALNKIASKHVIFPAQGDYAIIKRRFYQIAGFPSVVGAIDGTHIKIVAPLKDIEHVYYCRKGGHSKNVQIICDGEYIILNVNARFGGTAHDAYIWRRSAVNSIMKKRYTEGSRDCWLLGDSGYPLQPWLMTPISNSSTIADDKYNRSHKLTRNVLERCIGILKGRFRCLSKERVLRYSPESAGNIINACAVLHNVLIRAKFPYEQFMENEEIQETNCPIASMNNREAQLEGRQTLNRLVLTYFNE